MEESSSIQVCKASGLKAALAGKVLLPLSACQCIFFRCFSDKNGERNSKIVFRAIVFNRVEPFLVQLRKSQFFLSVLLFIQKGKHQGENKNGQKS